MQRQDGRRERQRSDRGRDADDGEDVEDVGSDDVADRETVFALHGADQRHREFGQARAECNQQDADDDFTDAQVARDLDAAVDKQLGTE